MCLAAIVAVERFCHKQTRGFMIYKITGSNAHGPVSALTPDIASILDQPFHFLSKGGQCYAFISQDKTTVLKFFKQHHIRLWNWFNQISLGPFDDKRKYLIQKHSYQSSFMFDSCKIALEDLKEETGLVYVHLNQTNIFKKKLIIYDNLKIAHQIDLDITDFVLQKKATSSYATLKRHMRNKNLYGAKECLDSLVSLIKEKQDKGIADRDFNIRTNIGYVGNRAIEIDLGSFYKGPQLETKKLELFKEWLEDKSPELYSYLNYKLEAIYGEVNKN